MPEPNDSLLEALTRAVSRSPWRRLRRGRRAAPAAGALSVAAVLTLLGVAAAGASHNVSAPVPAPSTPGATTVVTSPGSGDPTATPLRHTRTMPPLVAERATTLPVPPAGDTSDDPRPGGEPAPGTPAQPEATPHPTVTSARLGMGGGLTATLYAGQLEQLLRRLAGTVTFHTIDSLRAQTPKLCVITVVIEGVSGDQGAVYARGLGSGWGGAEGEPDQHVATDGGTLHQQLISPPPDASAGRSWTGSAALHVDGELVGVSADYRLTLEAVDGSVWTWRVGNGTPVECHV